MAKDESRVQSLLSAFTRKRSAPPKERPEVKPNAESPTSAYTPAMKTAIPLLAGAAGAAWDMAVTSTHNTLADPVDKLSATQRAASAIINGASYAAAASDFTNTTGSPMPGRILRATAISAAAPLAFSPLTKAGVWRKQKKDFTIARDAGIQAQHENEFRAFTGVDPDSVSFVQVGRPFL